MQKEVITLMHDHPTSGHLGHSKMMSRMRDRFYWLHMPIDVRIYCKNCLSCVKRKPPPKKTKARLQQQVSGVIFERIAIDFTGPFVECSSHNRYIMVVCDYFSKHCEAYPIPDISAETAAMVLVNEWICRYGVPISLHSDQGSSFEASLFQELCKLLQIDKTRTSPYRPQSDGMVERMMRTIKGMLYHYLSDKQEDWDSFQFSSVFIIYLLTMNTNTSDMSEQNETEKITIYVHG